MNIYISGETDTYKIVEIFELNFGNHYPLFLSKCTHLGDEWGKHESKTYRNKLSVIFQLNDNNDRTPPDIVRDTNMIIERHINKELESGCFYLRTTSKYMFLITKEMESLKAGLIIMKEILKQTLEYYFSLQNLEEFIKIGQFELKDCVYSIKWKD